MADVQVAYLEVAVGSRTDASQLPRSPTARRKGLASSIVVQTILCDAYLVRSLACSG